ncbi:hypothetical protein AQUSIP_11480 [Aquicella siphonis]|uniref:Uncharacterized protein n=1 Tax=Aquicella siphonis TaxID=254247 RepID=A0A5E4PHQ2_9COXI|nr:hypothetical protein [Aquicella siphonis]VVC75851.1 hypothetical protein AQUSIP_11480 [Aquicella siphonis]
MKIQLLDSNTKQPMRNYKLQLQVRGKDSGYISATTDPQGYFQLDEKYKGQQISPQLNGSQNQWFNANDGLKLYFNNTQAGSKQKQPSTTSHK